MGDLFNASSLFNLVSSTKCVENKTPLSEIIETCLCNPYWCTETNEDIKNILICGSYKLYNMTSELNKNVYGLQKIGKVDKAKTIIYTLNRIYMLYCFLALLNIQMYYNNEKFETYISIEELECIRANFLCDGIDISCLYECYISYYRKEIDCNNCKDCKECKECK